MDDQRWLRDLFSGVRCASCNCAYGPDGISVLGRRGDNWFLRCACPACGTQALGAVVVKEFGAVAEAPTAVDGAPPLTDEDVFTAHDLLREYAGDALGLFDGGDRIRKS